MVSSLYFDLNFPNLLNLTKPLLICFATYCVMSSMLFESLLRQNQYNGWF